MGPLSGATTLGQSGPGSDGNKGVIRILQSSSIAGTSPSDCWGGVLLLYREAVGVFYSPSQRGKVKLDSEAWIQKLKKKKNVK